MALPLQKFREIVLQLLYSQDIGRPEEPSMLDLMMNELEVSKKNVKMAQERVQLIRNLLSKIDPMIAEISTSYEFDRIQFITKNILRLGVYELLFDDLTPPKVAISEAIRLSRKFSTPESAAFVNALLDNLYQKSLGAQNEINPFSAEIERLKNSEELEAEIAQKKAAEKDFEENA